jgi:hypothetical protein
MRTLDQVLATYKLPFELEAMQKEDITRLADEQRALGDLPIGYGKTVIATCVALMLEPKVTVVLMPPILLVQWVKWINSIPGAGPVVCYTGSPAERKALPIKSARWIVTSYGIFRNDLERLTKELVDPMTIVDECQVLKSYKSKIFKAVRDFSNGEPLLLMSGTIMSKPGDGYAYVKLNSPEVYTSFTQFENIHVAKRDFFEQPIEWRFLDLLQSNLDLKRVKRTKEEVHSMLPKVNYVPIKYELSKKHMQLYRKLMDEQLLEVGDGKIDATTAGKLYSASQQIISNPDYYSDGEIERPDLYDIVDAALDEIGIGQPVMPGEPARSKLIIWSMFRRTSRGLLAYINSLAPVDKKGKQKWRAVGAYGEVDSKEGIRAFMEDDDALILVAQPGSAGAGLNPQHLCWEMLFAEYPTTTIPFWQCCGRVDRKGQLYNPTIRIATALGTIQENLLADLFSNDKLVQRASGTKNSIKEMLFPN